MPSSRRQQKLYAGSSRELYALKFRDLNSSASVIAPEIAPYWRSDMDV
jgi:hypothetical protein